MQKQFNLSKLYRGRDGNYRDVNGNIIGYLGEKGGLNGTAWKYLAQKYGKDYANRTSALIRNGKIYQDGHWRDNDIESDKSGKTASYKEAMSRLKQNQQAGNFQSILGKNSFIDIKTGKPVFYNAKDEVYVKKQAKQHASKTANMKEPEEHTFMGMLSAPVKKSEWDGNLDEAWDSFKFNGTKFLKGLYDASPLGTLERTYKLATDKNYHLSDFMLDGIAAPSKAINGATGILGSGVQALLPKSWESGVGKMGAFMDPSKWIGTAASYYDYATGKAKDWHGITNDANKGFGEGALGRNLSAKAQDTFNEAGNALVTAATLGGGGFAKSALSGARSALKAGTMAAAERGVMSGLKAGLKTAGRGTLSEMRAGLTGAKQGLNTLGKTFEQSSVGRGILNVRRGATQLEHSLKPVSKLPIGANLELAVNAAKNAAKVFSPGKIGFWGRAKAAGAAGLQGWFAADPMAFTYVHPGLSRAIARGWDAYKDIDNVEDYDLINEYYN